MGTSQLNLARKWRSKNFDQIVGQSISIRILKNSLFLGHFFPVYLFSGQRGCGKTTTARIFAAALNCENLSQFRKNPQTTPVPCQACDSCIAMVQGKHPDFIEIDAASHTGVDNVRNIIESCALSPIMAARKIYLIDEAHMLSKAAFNAFLKILEEPPSTALFILATTEPEKIIDTVRSRCFQLFFPALQSELLYKHLELVCTEEKIAYRADALHIIVKESGGSARDALNILEQVRFSSDIVDSQHVLRVLGSLDDQHIILLMHHALLSDERVLLEYVHSIEIGSCSIMAIWARLVECARALLWYMHNITPREEEHIDVILFAPFTGVITVEDVLFLLQILCDLQKELKQSKMQHILLEFALLKVCARKNRSPSVYIALTEDKKKSFVDNVIADKVDAVKNTQDELTATWATFLKEVQQLHDPLVFSIFSQAVISSHDPMKNIVLLHCPRELGFFRDLVEKTRSGWVVIAQRLFGFQITFDIKFIIEKKDINSPKNIKVNSEVSAQHDVSLQNDALKENENASMASALGRQDFRVKRTFVKRQGTVEAIDVSDEANWKLTHKILSVFPGEVTLV